MAKKKEPDKLSQDAASAKAAGMSYGNWKALQSDPVGEKAGTPEGWQECQYCGKLFKPKTKRPQTYCEIYCQREAQKERDRQRLAMSKT